MGVVCQVIFVVGVAVLVVIVQNIAEILVFEFQVPDLVLERFDELCRLGQAVLALDYALDALLDAVAQLLAVQR